MRRHTSGNSAPREDDEQIALIRWCAYQQAAYPELQLILHVPNGGSRGPVEAARFKAMGVRSGVPDLMLPVPRGKYHGLWIELKRTKGGRVEPNQAIWIHALRGQGYAVTVCRGWVEAAERIRAYLLGAWKDDTEGSG